MNEYFDKIGEECFDKLRELNPRGRIKDFIRMAVEFGYKKATSNRKELTKLKNLVKAQKEYIEILGEDLDSAATQAAIRGWKSTLIKDGRKARAKIKKYEQRINT